MHICDVCEEAVSDIHGITYSDDKTKVTYRGHKSCIDERYEQINRIRKDKSVQAVLKKLKLFP